MSLDCPAFALWYRDCIPTPLSLTGKRWRVRYPLDLSPGTQPSLAAEMILRTLAGERSLTNAEATAATCGAAATEFPDLPRAVDRIREGVARKETIAVFGDYDCDGVTSAALLARAFRRRGVRPILRLPHRLREGYGLRESVIHELHEAGTTLLITADTGITATKEIAIAASLGMDVIVLDHHRVPEELPEAYALVHPALNPNFYGPHPSAAGVVWTLVRAWEAADGNEAWPEQGIDLALAAIGTVADLVDIRGSNRTLVAAGVRALSEIKEGPLALLRLQSGLVDVPATSRDIAFRLAPRLNAAGRMAEPDIALRALLGDEQSLLQLEVLNRDRQDTVSALAEPLLETTRQSGALFLCARSEAYLPGICGLLAGKLTERFGKPSLVAHIQGQTCTASLRSVPAYNVTEGLARCSDLLTSFGGHAMAAGCSFPTTSFGALTERLQRDVQETVSLDDLTPLLEPDLSVDVRHLTTALSERLLTLEPYGQGNPEPLFLLQNVTLANPRVVGRDATHLQATLGDKKVIGFRLGSFLPQADQPLDLLCRIGIDTWQGRKSAQLFLEDLRVPVKESHSESAAPVMQAHQAM